MAEPILMLSDRSSDGDPGRPLTLLSTDVERDMAAPPVVLAASSCCPCMRGVAAVTLTVVVEAADMRGESVERKRGA